MTFLHLVTGHETKGLFRLIDMKDKTLDAKRLEKVRKIDVA